MAFVGRISPEKRVDRAIEIARRAGLELRIAAKVDAVDREYFAEEIEPLLAGPGVRFLGEIDEAEKADLLGGARALLFPIDWPEPFGMVVIEALSCGTPGDRVEPRLGARAARPRRHRLDRATPTTTAVDAVAAHRSDRSARVPAAFERRFIAERMARDYVAVYEGLTARSRTPACLEALSA